MEEYREVLAGMSQGILNSGERNRSRIVTDQNCVNFAEARVDRGHPLGGQTVDSSVPIATCCPCNL